MPNNILKPSHWFCSNCGEIVPQGSLAEHCRKEGHSGKIFLSARYDKSILCRECGYQEDYFAETIDGYPHNWTNGRPKCGH